MNQPELRQIFLSAVTREFGAHRLILKADLSLPQIKVQEQADLVQCGGKLLQTLDTYIREHCDAVIHLVGRELGETLAADEVRWLLETYADFPGRFPFLEMDLQATARRESSSLSYTQMEAWLAIYHGKRCHLYQPSELNETPLSPEHPQQRHWERLKARGEHHGGFHDPQHLSRRVLRDLHEILRGSSRFESHVYALMFTQLVDASTLKESLGDVDFSRHVAHPHNQIFHAMLERFSQAVEKNYTGEGFLTMFPGASDAVNAALLFQLALRQWNWERGAPLVRIGIHLGENVAQDLSDQADSVLTSQAADMCKRLTRLAAGGQIIMTRAVFDGARQSVREHPSAEGSEGLPLEWRAHGKYMFDGKHEPVEVFEVGAAGIAALEPPADSPTARRAVTQEEQEMLGWRPAAGLEIPQRVGWVVEDKLGEGGFGEVWLARHLRSRQPRVFKFCFDVARLRSFKRELTLFRLIRNVLGERDDIAKLLDVQLESPPYFLESLYVEQGNLSQWMESRGGAGEVPLATRVRLVAQVARATAAAHSLGIIHKDLKPNNVFIRLAGAEPQAVLADFGIGTINDVSAWEEGPVTLDGFTEGMVESSSGLGTRLYMPPESLVGQPATIAGDIYAMGVMLYQLVVGDLSRPLATGWERDVADDLLGEDIRACVEGNPQARLQNAGDLADRLESLDARRDAREIERHAAETSRHRRLRFIRLAISTAIVFCLVTAALGTISFVQWQRANQKERLAQRHLYESDMLRAHAAWYENRVGETIEMLERNASRLGDDEDLRQLDWHYLWKLCHADYDTLLGHKDQVWKVDVSHDGGLVASASGDGTVRIWRRRESNQGRSKPEERSFPVGGGVLCVAISQDGQLVAAAGQQGKTYVWNTRDGSEKHCLAGHAGNVWDIAFSPNSRTLATAGADHTVRIWNLEEREPIDRILAKHTEEALCLGFSFDGQQLASGGGDQTLRVWNTSDWTETLVRSHRSTIRDVAFNFDGSIVATAGNDQLIKLWNLRSESLESAKILSGHGNEITSVAFTPDGSKIISTSWDDTIRFWDVNSGREYRRLKGHLSDINHGAVSADGGWLATAGRDRSVKIWDLRESPQELAWDANAGGIYNIAFSPNGLQLASGGVDGQIRIWDAISGELLVHNASGHDGAIYTVAYGPDGKIIATAGEDNLILLWDAEQPGEGQELAGHAGDVWHVEFNARGNLIASASEDTTCRVWDVKKREPVRVFSGHEKEAWTFRFNEDGRRLVSSGADDSIKIWDLDSDNPIRSWKAHDGDTFDVVFLPGSDWIASAGANRNLKIWDSKGEFIKPLVGHTDDVYMLASDRKTKLLASCSTDHSVRLWDVNAGKSLLTLKGHAGEVWDVEFSPDGKRLASCSVDGTIRIWDTSLFKIEPE